MDGVLRGHIGIALICGHYLNQEIQLPTSLWLGVGQNDFDFS